MKATRILLILFMAFVGCRKPTNVDVLPEPPNETFTPITDNIQAAGSRSYLKIVNIEGVQCSNLDGDAGCDNFPFAKYFLADEEITVTVQQPQTPETIKTVFISGLVRAANVRQISPTVFKFRLEPEDDFCANRAYIKITTNKGFSSASFPIVRRELGTGNLYGSAKYGWHSDGISDAVLQMAGDAFKESDAPPKVGDILCFSYGRKCIVKSMYMRGNEYEVTYWTWGESCNSGRSVFTVRSLDVRPQYKGERCNRIIRH